ncbi:hypothetical protein GGX14DRAFT_407233, partial [Mycena pura]
MPPKFLPRKSRRKKNKDTPDSPSPLPTADPQVIADPAVNDSHLPQAVDPLDLDYCPRDSSITPPPPLAPAKKTRSRAVTVSDSDTETKAPAKKHKKNAGGAVNAAHHKLVLMVPRARVEGNQRHVLSHATTFHEALDAMHDTIGCTDVPKKPELMYKLSNSVAKAPSISLGSIGDWEGLLDEYLASLRTKLGIKNVGPKVKASRGSKVPILDLEHAGSGDDDFDEGLGIMEKERTFVEQLQAKYGHCQLCGSDVACKIDVSASRVGKLIGTRNPQCYPRDAAEQLTVRLDVSTTVPPIPALHAHASLRFHDALGDAAGI